MPLLLYVMIALTVGLATLALWSALGASQAGVRARLQALTRAAAGAETAAVSVLEEDAPKNLGERVLVAVGEKEVRKQSAERRESLRTLLRHAGFRRPSAIALVLGLRVVLTIGLPIVAAPMLFSMLPSDPMTALVVLAGPAAAGYALPGVVIGRMVARRHVKITAALPDVLDLLVLCMEAGLGLNAAITRVAEERADGRDPLGEEFAQLANELRVGVSRKDALTNLATRVGSKDVRTVVAQLIHTERLGGNVGPALRSQAETVRATRKMRIEEIANRAPVKMLFPTMIFVMPLFIFIFAPLVIEVMASFGS
ncbi:MAG TPA: type II secretion system F family protein [Candidatus Binatia bacterium]|nr:type II secretion system F family protein [Candidatus Binatia bacterium]